MAALMTSANADRNLAAARSALGTVAGAAAAAAEKQLSEPLQGLFAAGNEMQENVVDLATGRLEAWSADRLLGAALDVAQRAIDLAGRLAGAGAGGDDRPGWGPMPALDPDAEA
jgi:hypothetical protein